MSCTPHIPNFMAGMAEQKRFDSALSFKEDFVNGILKDFLDRDPSEEDYFKIHYGRKEYYLQKFPMYYKGHLLGHLKEDLRLWPVDYNMSFIPSEAYEILKKLIR